MSTTIWKREKFEGTVFGRGRGKGVGLLLAPTEITITLEPVEARELAALLLDWAEREERCRSDVRVAYIVEAP